MRRAMIRLAMSATGLAALLFYASWAYLTYWAIGQLWMNRPSALGTVGFLIAVTVVVGYASYRFGTRRVLASIPGDRVTRASAPRLYRRLESLCGRMKLPVPDIVVARTGEPNAFAISGPDGGVVVIDVALIRLLTPAELDTVVAHELAHLEGYDSLIRTLSFTGIQTIVLVLLLSLAPFILLLTGVSKALAWARGQPSEWTRGIAWQLQQLLLTLVMLAPLVVTFLLFARSRRREFAADRRAAEVTGNPVALARAIRKIDLAVRRELHLRRLLAGEQSDDTSDPLFWLLSTHPAPERRIERLLEVVENQHAETDRVPVSQ